MTNETHYAEPALFGTVRAALRFAYSITEQSIVVTANYLPPSGKPGRFTGLSVHDQHAQGALIRRMVETRLEGIELAMTFADHGNGAVHHRAVRDVARHLRNIVRRTGLVGPLVERHFSKDGNRRTQRELAAEFNLSERTLIRLDKDVGDAIDGLRTATEKRLEALFVHSGICDSL